MPNTFKGTFIQHILCILLEKLFKPMDLYLLSSWISYLIYLSACTPIFQSQTYSHFLFFYISFFTYCLLLCGNYSLPSVCRGQEERTREPEWMKRTSVGKQWWTNQAQCYPSEQLRGCSVDKNSLHQHVEEFKCQNLQKARCASPACNPSTPRKIKIGEHSKQGPLPQGCPLTPHVHTHPHSGMYVCTEIRFISLGTIQVKFHRTNITLPVSQRTSQLCFWTTMTYL